MKIIVIGLGSMGKRRIRLLKEKFSNIEIAGIDLNPNRREKVGEEFNILTYKNIEEAIEEFKPNASIVSSSPLSHSEIILTCLRYNLHVFSEINLVNDGYEEIIRISRENKKELFLSSTMMYRKEIDYIRETVKNTRDVFSYRYHVGQYLPDWHPWEDYKNFFVSDKRTNGCREIMGIELPWIIKTFGKIKKIDIQKFKISKLDLDYPDLFNILLEHEEGHNGVLTFDIVSRRAIRNLEVISENNHIFWDGTPNTLENYNLKNKKNEIIQTYEDIIKNNNYASNIIENVYLEELEIFIDKILQKKSNEKYTFEDDKYTIEIMDKIEEKK